MGLRLNPSADAGFIPLYAEAAAALVEATQVLTELLGADEGDRAGLLNHSQDLQRRGAEATDAIARRLERSFITPFDRRDMYDLARALDTCHSHVDAAVEVIVAYQVTGLPSHATTQVELLCRMAELTATAMPRLRATSSLADYWVEVARLARRSSRARIAAGAELFAGPHKALSVLRQSAVVEELAAAAQACARVAQLVERLALQES